MTENPPVVTTSKHPSRKTSTTPTPLLKSGVHNTQENSKPSSPPKSIQRPRPARQLSNKWAKLEYNFINQQRDVPLQEISRPKKNVGKLVKIRGNPYKEFMTDYTQDGRKYTQSLTRAVLIKEAELVQ